MQTELIRAATRPSNPKGTKEHCIPLWHAHETGRVGWASATAHRLSGHKALVMSKCIYINCSGVLVVFFFLFFVLFVVVFSY